MSKLNTSFIAALDIGATKVVCFIAKVSPDGEMNIIGIGHQVSQGIKSGAITDIKLAEKSIRSAVGAAEQMAGINIDKLVVNISTNKQKSHNIRAEMKIAGNEVTLRDMNQLVIQGCEKYRKDDYEVIHCIPLNYSIDGTDGVKNPLGMYCKSLGSNLHIITAHSPIIFNYANCLAQCHLNTEDYISSAYASGIAVLEEDEKELGATVIDFGGSSTSIAIFKDGEMVYTDTIPVGGMHVTNDIAIGLSTSVENAERIKTLYGNVISSPKDDQEIIDIPQIGEDGESDINHIQKSDLIAIIRPRVEEILEMIKSKLDKSEFKNVGGNIVITGGGSQLFGLRELTGKMLKRQVRSGSAQYIEGIAESTKGPSFATCTGMLLLAIEKRNRKSPGLAARNMSANSLLGRIVIWFRENF